LISRTHSIIHPGLILGHELAVRVLQWLVAKKLQGRWIRAAKTALAEALRSWANGPEQQSAANLPDGVLNERQVQALGLLLVSAGYRRDPWCPRLFDGTKPSAL